MPMRNDFIGPLPVLGALVSCRSDGRFKDVAIKRVHQYTDCPSTGPLCDTIYNFLQVVSNNILGLHFISQFNYINLNTWTF